MKLTFHSMSRGDNITLHDMLRTYRYKASDRIYDAKMRYEWTSYSIYTDDDKLLTDMLAEKELIKKLTRVDYLSKQFTDAMESIHGIATGVLIMRNPEPHQKFRIFLKNNYSNKDLQTMVINLRDYLEGHDNFAVSDDNKRRMNDGKIFDSNYCYFYCDDQDALTFVCLIAGPAIHKIQKIIKKEKTQ